MSDFDNDDFGDFEAAVVTAPAPETPPQLATVEQHPAPRSGPLLSDDWVNEDALPQPKPEPAPEPVQPVAQQPSYKKGDLVLYRHRDGSLVEAKVGPALCILSFSDVSGRRRNAIAGFFSFTHAS